MFLSFFFIQYNSHLETQWFFKAITYTYDDSYDYIKVSSIKYIIQIRPDKIINFIMELTAAIRQRIPEPGKSFVL